MSETTSVRASAPEKVRPRMRMPLQARILLWFFLNLLLLALVFACVFAWQFRGGWDPVVAGFAGQRVQTAAQLIASDLRTTPSENWPAVLKKFDDAYGVAFALYSPMMEPIAGDLGQLPLQVLARMRETMPPEDMRERTGPLHRQARDRDRGEAGDSNPQPGVRQRRRAGAFNRDPSQDPDVGPPPTRQPGPPGRGRFFLRTTNPTAYWVGVHLNLRPPLSQPLAERPEVLPGPQQAQLIMRSTSLSAGGLLFDLTPWAIAGGSVLILSVLFWLPMVRGITGSIGRIRAATQSIAEGRFDTRAPETRRDELGDLGASINSMAARLEGLVQGQKRFLGDTAHELCAPIARLQVALGILEETSDERYRSRLADLREEVNEMSGLVNELLSFSKASLRPATTSLQPVNLRECLQAVCKREAQDNPDVSIDIAPDLTVQAQPELLSRAAANILRNAIRYAGGTGPIRFAAQRAEADWVELTLADQGSGVPPEALSRIFDPFYRVESSHSRDTGGAGLGLAIVSTCVAACGGTVTARNRTPAGLEVSIRLRSAKVAPTTTGT